MKARVREIFSGERTIKHTEKIISEFTLDQDRLIIPPVTTKDSFYSSHISSILWRSARKFIQETSHLIVIGYSLPPEDFITGQLIREIPDYAKITVTDRFASNDKDYGIIKNLDNLGIKCSPEIFSGENHLTDLISSITPEYRFDGERRICFIEQSTKTYLPIALAEDKKTLNYCTMIYSPLNEYSDHGMPIHEQMENQYSGLQLNFNIYESINKTNGNIHLEEKI